MYKIAVNAVGEVYAAGAASSTDFPTTPGALQNRNKANPGLSGYATFDNYNYFLTKLNATASGLVFSTYVGSSGGEVDASNGEAAGSIALDARENVFFAGTSFGIDYPVTQDAFQAHNNSAGNGYIVIPPNIAQPKPPVFAASGNAVLTELTSTGTLVYSTYLGGSGYPEYSYDLNQGKLLSTFYGPDTGTGLVQSPGLNPPPFRRCASAPC